MTGNYQKVILPGIMGYRNGVVEEKYLLPSEMEDDCFSPRNLRLGDCDKILLPSPTSHNLSGNSANKQSPHLQTSLWPSTFLEKLPSDEQNSYSRSQYEVDRILRHPDSAAQTNSDIQRRRLVEELRHLPRPAIMPVTQNMDYSYQYLQHYASPLNHPEPSTATHPSLDWASPQQQTMTLPSGPASPPLTADLFPEFSSELASDQGDKSSSVALNTGSEYVPFAQTQGTTEDMNSAPYATLIYHALMSAPSHKMVLKDIYDWFEANTDKARVGSEKGWQNSIRHNLSMNKGFRKVEQRSPTEDGKKGFVWVLDESAIRAGGVESTTRYRKNNSAKRISRNDADKTFRQRALGPSKSVIARPHRRRRALKAAERSPAPSVPGLTQSTSEAAGPLSPEIVKHQSSQLRSMPLIGAENVSLNDYNQLQAVDSSIQQSGDDHFRLSQNNPASCPTDQMSSPSSSVSSSFTSPIVPFNYNFQDIIGCSTGLEVLDRDMLYSDLELGVLQRYVYVDMGPCRPGHHTIDCEGCLCRY